MGERQPKQKSKTNQKLKKAPTRPIAIEISATGPAKEGIALFKENPMPFVAGVAALAIGSIVLALVGAKLGPLGIVTQGLSFVLSTFLGANLMQMALNAHDRKPVSIDQLKSVPPSFVNYLATSVVVGIVTSIGMVLFIIPGLIAIGLLSPALALVVDKQLDPVSALQRSVAIAKPHVKEILSAMVVLGVLNFIGMLCLGIGLLATIPISMLGMVCIYRSIDR